MRATTTATTVPLLLALVLAGCGQGAQDDARPGSPVGTTLSEPPGEGTAPADGGTVGGGTTDGGTTEDGMGEDGTTEDTPTTGPPASRTPVPPAPGDPSVSRPGAADLPADPAGAELTLVVGAAGGGEQAPVTLSCDFRAGTATGSHPQADQACADLRAALDRGNPFAPVPPDVMCTQVYGGDAVVDVTGAVLAADGGPVDVSARFSLTDGCEIDRWQQMGAVLAPFGGAV